MDDNSEVRPLPSPAATWTIPGALAVLVLVVLAVVAGPVVRVDARDGVPSGPSDVRLVHGIPEEALDVVVRGRPVVRRLAPGDALDLTPYAGQTWTEVELRTPAGELVLGPIDEVVVPAAGEGALVAHLTADGRPRLTTFTDLAPPADASTARVAVVHVARAGEIDVVDSSGVVRATLLNGQRAVFELTAATIVDLAVVVDGGTPSTIPTDVVEPGRDVTVFVVVGADGVADLVIDEIDEAAVDVDDVAGDDGPVDAREVSARVDSAGPSVAPIRVDTGEPIGGLASPRSVLAVLAGLVAVSATVLAVRSARRSW